MTNKTKMIQIRVNTDQWELVDKAYKRYISTTNGDSVSKAEFIRHRVMLSMLSMLGMVTMGMENKDEGK